VSNLARDLARVTSDPITSRSVPSKRTHLGCISVRLGPLGFPTWSGNLRRGGAVTHWVAVARRG